MLGAASGGPWLFSQAGSGCSLLPQGLGPGGESRSLQGSSLASVAKTARPFSGHPGGHPGALRAVTPAWLGVGPPQEEGCV